MKIRISSTIFRGFLLAIALVIACSSTVAQQRQRRSSRSAAQSQAQANEEQTIQQQAAKPKSRPPSVPTTLDRAAEKLKVTESQKHANLTIFLIEGADRVDTTNVLTLSEALARKNTVIVKETGNVNELTVENKDPEHTVFIMAGDIVKGGKQDRTLATDLPLMTKSGVVPIGAFCVEQGRWSARGGEDVSRFSSSEKSVASKDGKVALRRSKAQGEVWESVAKAQEKLSRSVGKPVADAASPTSLQLTLEDTTLKKKNEAFFGALGTMVEKNKRAIGFVCVINGEINGAEIFAGHDLFRRAWPKLLEAAATEAIGEQKEKIATEAITAEKAAEFLVRSEDTKATKEQIHGPFWSVTGENETSLLFQTIDESTDARWLRRSVIKK